MTSAPHFTAAQLGPVCLVTGGAGYAGSAIVRRLRSHGCEVRSLDILSHDHGADVQCIQADLCDGDALRTALEGVDTVFHTAALISLLSYARPAQRRLVHKVNVTGTATLLSAAQACGVSRFVHTSSGNVIMDRVLDEKDETQPYATRTRDLYSTTKIAAEKLALTADDPAGMRVCATRPGGLWGPDLRCVMLRSFLDQVAAGRLTALIGDGQPVMDNTHVENLVDGQLLAAAALAEKPSETGGQAFFIMDNERVNPMEWFRPLAEGLGYTFPTRRVPVGVMRLVAHGSEIAHLLGAPEPIITVRALRNLVESSSFRIDKAQRVLGYQPRFQRHPHLLELIEPARAYLAAQ